MAIKKLLKAEEVAEILDVHKARIYQLTRENLIPHVTVGDRQYRYSEEKIIEWIENGGTTREVDK